MNSEEFQLAEIERLMNSGFNACWNYLFDTLDTTPKEEEIIEFVKSGDNQFNEAMEKVMLGLTAILKTSPSRVVDAFEIIARNYSPVWLYSIKMTLPTKAPGAILVNAIKVGHSNAAIGLVMCGASTEYCSGHDLAMLSQYAHERVKSEGDDFHQAMSWLLNEAQRKRRVELQNELASLPPECQNLISVTEVAIGVNDATQYQEALELLKGEHETACFSHVYYSLLARMSRGESVVEFANALATTFKTEFKRYMLGIIAAIKDVAIPDKSAVEIMNVFINGGTLAIVMGEDEVQRVKSYLN